MCLQQHREGEGFLQMDFSELYEPLRCPKDSCSSSYRGALCALICLLCGSAAARKSYSLPVYHLLPAGISSLGLWPGRLMASTSP